MKKTKEIRTVFVTVPTFEIAKQVSKILVSERLAACCSVIQNVISYFGWQNSLHERNEYLLIIKTSDTLLDALQERILQITSDEVPEIIALPVFEIFDEYEKWLKSSLI